MISRSHQPEIDAADIAERLVGITSVQLQNFYQHGPYGLHASVQGGKVRQQRRLFAEDDIFGIALVWQLFECGLRSGSIVQALNEIARTKKPNANLAAKKLRAAKAEFLVIVCKARGPRRPPPMAVEQRVEVVKGVQLARAVKTHESANLIGNSFPEVTDDALQTR